MIPLPRANNISIMLTQFAEYRSGALEVRHAVLTGTRLGLERLSLLLQVSIVTSSSPYERGGLLFIDNRSPGKLLQRLTPATPLLCCLPPSERSAPDCPACPLCRSRQQMTRADPWQGSWRSLATDWETFPRQSSTCKCWGR